MPVKNIRLRKSYMRKIIFIILAITMCTTAVLAQKSKKKAKIKFETTEINMGTFPADSAIIECAFVYENTGDAPLYIHRVITSCGCTDKRFPTAPLAPGHKDTIFITYNGTRKSPGHVRKSVTVHCNAVEEMVRLRIKGSMLPVKVVEIPEVEEIE